MIEVKSLTKVYQDPDGNDVPAVTDASLSCRAGEIFGLLGPNGAGKTTTLRCLATILAPTSGTAVIAGYDLAKDPQDVRRNIGFLSANTGLYARLTPRETLRFFGELHGLHGSALDDRVRQVLELFDITSYADRPNDRLSTGMKQRVGLARAVVHDPPVLILDEPTTGLDPIVTQTVEQAVIALAKLGKCVLFSTHLLEQAQEICGRIGVIAHGRVAGQGTIAELCALTKTATLRQAFFALAGQPAAETQPVPVVPVLPGERTGGALSSDPAQATGKASSPAPLDAIAPHSAESRPVQTLRIEANPSDR